LFALVASCVALCGALQGCATVRVADVDLVSPQGEVGTLSALRGHPLVIDVCASWAPPCAVNARVLDEVHDRLVQDGVPADAVQMLTLLLDDDATVGEALRGYAETLEVKHAVMRAGPRMRAGQSALGGVGYIPRIVLVDREGRVVLDEAGGVLGVNGLYDKVRPLVR
jgi:hypothetical protein